jgi:hypothetical protein
MLRLVPFIEQSARGNHAVRPNSKALSRATPTTVAWPLPRASRWPCRTPVCVCLGHSVCTARCCGFSHRIQWNAARTSSGGNACASSRPLAVPDRSCPLAADTCILYSNTTPSSSKYHIAWPLCRHSVLLRSRSRWRLRLKPQSVPTSCACRSP